MVSTALHLEETGRPEQAVSVLRELVAAKDQIDRETYEAAYQILERLS